MASKIITKGLKRTALSVALGMCFAGSVLAQSNSTGVIQGTTTAGATVVVENPATGFRREITASADGSYRVGSLQPGTYKVTAGGQSRDVNVSVGGTSTATLDTVRVVGGQINPIDVASVESSTVLTSEQIAKIPVPRNITAVALLAPGTVRGDAAFGNLASFGGSSVAENQYFVNGFNISNAFAGLDFGQIPFEAIAEQQVKTGGYGAEFGRSTGGVINLVTKRGSNEFHAGGNIFWTPNSLASGNPDVYTNEGFIGVNNMQRASFLFGDNSKDERGTNTVATVWASGALVQDRLFAYALLQYGKLDGVESYPNAWVLNTRAETTTNSASQQRSPNWLLKLDWSINDSHSLELTAFSDKRKSEIDVYESPKAGNPSCTAAHLAANPPIPPVSAAQAAFWATAQACQAQPYPDASLVTQRGPYKGTFYTEDGGSSWSLKYTGYLTDSFTLTALYGRGESKRSERGVYANGVEAIYDGDLANGAGGCPLVQDVSGEGLLTSAGITPCNFFGAIGSINNKDEREQFRIDAEWALGDHLIRFGYDSDKFTSFDATDLEGGAQWFLLTDGIAEGVFFRNGAEVEVKSQAFYIEDTWNVTDNFIVYGGLRWDSFKNLNGDGDAYVTIKNQFAPRLGFSWDVNGDSSFKVFGNAGRYFLPLSATVAIRGASASLYEDTVFSYTSLDPVTGEPQGLTIIDQHYLNGENGLPKDPDSIASFGLKPQYQDEYIAGFQFKLNDNVTAGVRGVYRDLKSAIDDFCDYRYFAQVATDMGIAFDPSRLNYCHLYNPGEDSTFLADIDGSGTFTEIFVPANYYATLRRDPQAPLNNDPLSPDYNPLRFSPEEIAMIDKGSNAKRNYKAVEFFAEGHWDKLFLQGSYTWAKSYGNFEGGVKSDIGQADTGTTQDFDYPELTIGSTGYLPNDRRHSFKLFGNYELTDEWSFGFNLLIQSGRPQNCLGIYGGDPIFYRNSYFSCDDTLDNACTVNGDEPGDVNNCPPWGPASGRLNNGYTRGNRGDRGRTEWMRNLDLNVAYKPNFAAGNLTLKMDVFNVFNEHAATSVWERGENRTGRPMQDTYLIPTSFQAARSFRFMVQYEF